MDLDLGLDEDITFQEASGDDSELIYRWRFDPRTTRFMRSKQKAFEDHDKWFQKALRDPDEFIGFALYRGRKVGVVRLSLSEIQGTLFAETGQYLDPDLHGKGFGLQVSVRYRRWFAENVRPIHICVSKIFEENAAAQKIAEKRGAEKLPIKVWGTIPAKLLFQIVREYFDRGEPPQIRPPDGSSLDYLVYVTRMV